MSNDQDVECELADDVYYEFDSSGKLVDEISHGRESVLKSASMCVSSALSDDMWEVKEGKLIRKMIR